MGDPDPEDEELHIRFGSAEEEPVTTHDSVEGEAKQAAEDKVEEDIERAREATETHDQDNGVLAEGAAREKDGPGEENATGDGDAGEEMPENKEGEACSRDEATPSECSSSIGTATTVSEGEQTRGVPPYPLPVTLVLILTLTPPRTLNLRFGQGP